MRRVFLCFLLCLCLLPLGAGATSEEMESPALLTPYVGYARLGELYGQGERVSFTFSLVPTGFFGGRSNAVRLLANLLSGVSARYDLQQGEDSALEALTVAGLEGTLLSFTHLYQGQSEWLSSPQLSQPLYAAEGGGLLSALYGDVVSAWPEEAPPSLDAAPDWASLRAALSPVGSPEEGYAALLEGEEGLALLSALVLRVDVGVLQDWPSLLPDSLRLTEPLSLYWQEDEAGNLTNARFVTALSLAEEAPWNLNFTLRETTRRNRFSWECSGQASRGEDLWEMTFTGQTDSSSRQIDRSLRLRLEGTRGGYSATYDIRETDRNIYGEEEGELSERIRRTLTVRATDQAPEAALENRNALNLSLEESGTVLSTPQRVVGEGTLTLEALNGGDTLVSGSMPYVLRTEQRLQVSPPADARDVDLTDSDEVEALRAEGQQILEAALARWMDGLDEETKRQIFPTEAPL